MAFYSNLLKDDTKYNQYVYQPVLFQSIDRVWIGRLRFGNTANVHVPLGKSNFDAQCPEAPIQFKANRTRSQKKVVVYVGPNAQSKNQGAVAVIHENDFRPGIFKDIGGLGGNIEKGFAHQIDIRTVGHTRVEFADACAGL